MENWVRPAPRGTIEDDCRIFGARSITVEPLVDDEGDSFTSVGDVEEEILSITAVHPMREDAVGGLLKKAGVGWSLVRRMVEEGRLAEIEYRKNKFYVRKRPAR